MIELAVAVLLIGAGVWFYRRKDPTADKADNYGGQGAVILIVIGVIVGIHGLGLLKYHPSKAEAEMMQDRGK